MITLNKYSFNSITHFKEPAIKYYLLDYSFINQNFFINQDLETVLLQKCVRKIGVRKKKRAENWRAEKKAYLIKKAQLLEIGSLPRM